MSGTAPKAPTTARASSPASPLPRHPTRPRHHQTPRTPRRIRRTRRIHRRHRPPRTLGPTPGQHRRPTGKERYECPARAGKIRCPLVQTVPQEATSAAHRHQPTSQPADLLHPTHHHPPRPHRPQVPTTPLLGQPRLDHRLLPPLPRRRLVRQPQEQQPRRPHPRRLPRHRPRQNQRHARPLRRQHQPAPPPRLDHPPNRGRCPPSPQTTPPRHVTATGRTSPRPDPPPGRSGTTGPAQHRPRPRTNKTKQGTRLPRALLASLNAIPAATTLTADVDTDRGRRSTKPPAQPKIGAERPPQPIS